MKLRLDFVTNSSSASYIVRINKKKLPDVTFDNLPDGYSKDLQRIDSMFHYLLQETNIRGDEEHSIYQFDDDDGIPRLEINGERGWVLWDVIRHMKLEKYTELIHDGPDYYEDGTPK